MGACDGVVALRGAGVGAGGVGGGLLFAPELGVGAHGHGLQCGGVTGYWGRGAKVVVEDTVEVEVVGVGEVGGCFRKEGIEVFGRWG